MDIDSPSVNIFGIEFAFIWLLDNAVWVLLASFLEFGGQMEAVEMQTNQEDINPMLVQRCQQNDPEACNQLFSFYHRRIFNTAYRILGEEASAEDALQETLINVFRGLGKFRGDSKVSTWISRITINVCLGMLRRSKNWQYLDTEDENMGEIPADMTEYTDPVKYASAEELRALVTESFRRMTEKQRIVVRLHDLEGRTIQEISRMIKCPVGTVKSRLFYGREEFKGIFSTLTNRGFKPASLN
jgi:RNA polymerase sigma factor (sigma-70 family)